MNKQSIYSIIYSFIVAIICLYLFSIPIFLVLLFLFLATVYILYREAHEVHKLSSFESNQLLHQMKTTRSDAYLKQKQLNTIVASLPFPLILLDREGKVVLYNKEFEVFRKNSDSLDLTYTVNDFDRKVASYISDAFIFENRLDKTMQINEINYEAISVPITTNGKFSGCIVLFQDISKAMEKEELQKQFVADASHELRTPISAIMGMIEILNREDFKDDDTRKEFLLQIQKETARLETIVSSLLKLSRIASDVIALHRELLDFTIVIDDCVRSFSPLAKERGVTIETQYFTHDPIYIDREQMEIVVNNLLSNALSYSDSKSITLKTYVENNEDYVFEIIDYGKGIDDEHINKIFERFYRIDNVRSRKDGGTGLGLSIVKSIIDAHGFNIEVSSATNQGTTFKITCTL